MMSASQQAQAQAETERLYQLMHDVFRGGLAGTLSGIFFLGFGARVVMRISALLNPEAKGVLTENENVVGEITIGGTLELVLFVGLFGGFLVGTVWVIVRDWLPREPVQRTLLAGFLAALTGSTFVIAASNRDFRILDPPALHVAMFVLLVGLTGLATAGLDRYLEGRLPSRGSAVAVLGGLASFGLVFALPLLIFSFFSDNNAGEQTPWPAGLALISVVVATISGWARYYANGEAGLATRPIWQRQLGVGGVALFGLLSTAHLVDEINKIV